jgi:excisionase family DNA binding protein
MSARKSHHSHSTGIPATTTGTDPKQSILQRIESLPHPVLTVLEVASLLRVSTSFVRKLIDAGTLEAINTAGSPNTRRYYRIHKESLVAYAEQKSTLQSP